MEVVVNSKLTKNEALSRIKHIFSKLKEEYSSQISNVIELWNENVLDFSFDVQGAKMNGKLTVDDYKVTIVSRLPWYAFMFKKRIINTIRTEAEKLLRKNP